jgi:hypothetical protein
MSTPQSRNGSNWRVIGAILVVALAGCEDVLEPTGPGDVSVESVSVSAPSEEVEEGATLQLTAAVSPFGASQAVSWATSDATTALVDASGLVTPVSLGDVTITATSTEDASKSGQIEITVTCRNLVQAMVADGGTVPGDVCYQVLTPLSVNDGTLVVEAGANISFGTGGSLAIASAGRLTAVGTVDDPILFTSLDPAQRWRGIRFAGSASTDNRLEHVTLENGGSSGWGGYAPTALLIEGGSRVDITATEIAGSAGPGLTVFADVELTLGASTLSDNDVAAWVHPDAVRSIGADNVFAGNDANVVRVGFGNNDAVTTGQTWAAIGVPFEMQDRMYVEAPLTIDPGAELRFRADVSMIVRNGGSLTAQGTVDAPIAFSGVENLPGFWQGIRIATISTDNVFDHVVFEDGGGTVWSGDTDSRAMVYLDPGSKAVFTNTTFRGSGHYGLWVPGGGDIEGFAGNVFEANARTAVVHPNHVGAIASDNSFVDNDEQFLRVSFGNNDAVAAAQTWSVLEVPYRVTVRTFVRAPLVIEAGTAMEFAQGAHLVVTEEGSLSAVGTPASPITFSGAQAVAGYWKGLQFGTVSVSNVLSNVLVEHAGSEAWFGGANSTGSIWVTGDGLLDLADVTIRLSGGYALLLSNGGAVTCSNVDDGGFMYYDFASSSSSPTCP